MAALNEPAPTVSHGISVVAGPRPRAVRRGPFAKGGRVSGARPWVLPPTPCHGDRRQRCTPPREAGHRPIPAIWRTRGSPLARKPPHPRRPLCRPIGGCPTHQPANPPEVRFRTDEWDLFNLFGCESQVAGGVVYATVPSVSIANNRGTLIGHIPIRNSRRSLGISANACRKPSGAMSKITTLRRS